MRDPRSRDSFPRETWLLHLLSIDIAIYANKLFLHINDWSDLVLVKRVAKKKHPIAVLPFLQAANRIHRSRLSPSISLSRETSRNSRVSIKTISVAIRFSITGNLLRTSLTCTKEERRGCACIRIQRSPPPFYSLSLSLSRAPVLPVDASVCIHVLGYDRVGPLSGPADCL